ARKAAAIGAEAHNVLAHTQGEFF
nr:hypothetical protein [Tanacetum cinerariifolium]